MRLLATVLALLLPAQAFAADVGKRGPFLPALPRPAIKVPAVAAPNAPVFSAAAPAAAGPGAAAARVAAVGAQVAKDAAAPAVSAEAGAAASDGHLRLLQGGEADEKAPAVSGVEARGPNAPLPPPSPEKKSAIRRMVLGSMGYKLGMEAMTTSIPFVAMMALGGATAVALLTVAVYGVAQAVSSSFSGSLAEKLPARAILAGAVLGQAGLVVGVVGLGLAGMLTPWTLFPLYAVVGTMVGAAETSRRLIPTLVLGQDEEALRRYNATLHIWYEVAGVAGALIAGGVIWGVTQLAGSGALGALGSIKAIGPLAAMALTPLAALAGGLTFWSVKHGKPPSTKSDASAESFGLLDALKLIWSDVRLRAVSLAMLLPWIVHRVFEHLVAPLYAKTALAEPAFSGVLIAASNLGELLGALLLLRLSQSVPGPYRWVRWGAYGVAAAWVLSGALAAGLTGWTAIALLAPLILVFSMTWAGSHVSLETEVQKRVGEHQQPRVFGLLFGSYVVGAALASLGAGWLIDHLGISAGIAVITALFSAVGLSAWWASRKLKS